MNQAPQPHIVVLQNGLKTEVHQFDDAVSAHYFAQKQVLNGTGKAIVARRIRTLEAMSHAVAAERN